MRHRSAIATAVTAATLAASSADAQTFWMPRANGLSYAGNIAAGHNNNPIYDLDIRSTDQNPAVITTFQNSGDSTGLLSKNHSRRGTAIEGRATARWGQTVGLLGTAFANRGVGVQGRAPHGTAVAARTNTGTAFLAEVFGNGYAAMFLGGESYFEKNTGFGVVDPVERVHVDGIARIDNGRLDFGEFATNSDAIQIFRDNSRGNASSTLVLRVGEDNENNDRVEIRRGSQTVFEFHNSGSAYKPGGGSWSVLSDRRAKHDINDLDGSLEKLMGLRGVTYYYNDPNAVGAAEGLQTGFIAQEIEEVFPEWVGELEDGTKTVSIKGFEALTVESIRELRDEKDAQIAELRAENSDLADRLAALEALVAEMNSGN